ncbi:MAG: hypothetical protein NC218_09020 [Acetobacter sp.]|nr:hypothetical protein [Acetobacter sp.]
MENIINQKNEKIKFMATLMIMAICYYKGWHSIDSLERCQEYVLNGLYPLDTKAISEKTKTLMLLAYIPFFLSFVSANLTAGIYVTLASFCWAVYATIMLINKFFLFHWGICICFSIFYSFFAAIFIMGILLILFGGCDDK